MTCSWDIWQSTNHRWRHFRSDRCSLGEGTTDEIVLVDLCDQPIEGAEDVKSIKLQYDRSTYAFDQIMEVALKSSVL